MMLETFVYDDSKYELVQTLSTHTKN